jgi:hypothetical protein
MYACMYVYYIERGNCVSVSALLQLLQLWRSSVAALLQLQSLTSKASRSEFLFSFSNILRFGKIVETRALTIFHEIHARCLAGRDRPVRAREVKSVHRVVAQSNSDCRVCPHVIEITGQHTSGHGQDPGKHIEGINQYQIVDL